MDAPIITIIEKIDSSRPLLPQMEALTSRATKMLSLGSKDTFALELILDEILTNILTYGRTDDEPMDITVEITGGNDSTRVCVTDNGPSFNPLSAEPPDLNAPLQERKIGGLGLLIVKKMTDEQDYRREGRCNILTLKRKYGID